MWLSVTSVSNIPSTCLSSVCSNLVSSYVVLLMYSCLYIYCRFQYTLASCLPSHCTYIHYMYIHSWDTCSLTHTHTHTHTHTPHIHACMQVPICLRIKWKNLKIRHSSEIRLKCWTLATAVSPMQSLLWKVKLNNNLIGNNITNHPFFEGNWYKSRSIISQ